MINQLVYHPIAVVVYLRVSSDCVKVTGRQKLRI